MRPKPKTLNPGPSPLNKTYSSRRSSAHLRALLGEFEYEEMQKTDAVVGPLLFLTFMLLVLFVLVNMFIAILSEAYEKAKIEVRSEKRPRLWPV